MPRRTPQLKFQPSVGSPDPNLVAAWVADWILAPSTPPAPATTKTTTYRSIEHRLGTILNTSIRRGVTDASGLKWSECLPFTMGELRARLDATMPTGCDWSDFMAGRLHLDHIRPLSRFRFSKVTHAGFAKAWALTNLRLLPARENVSRHARKRRR